MLLLLFKFSRNNKESFLSTDEELLGEFQVPYYLSYCLQSIFSKLCKNEMEWLSYRNQCCQSQTLITLNCLIIS